MLQILRYGVGQFYAAHYDSLSETSPRVATVLIYLAVRGPPTPTPTPPLQHLRPWPCPQPSPHNLLPYHYQLCPCPFDFSWLGGGLGDG